MPLLDTAHFGAIEYEETSVLEFPDGIPAFEEETRFVVIERAETAPVVFLQSARRADLAFLTLPVRLVDPTYRSAIGPEDLDTLGLNGDRQPEEGREVITLAIITIDPQKKTTANLMAPIVINCATRRALQSVQPESGYPVRFALPGKAEAGR
jgi:flagellar assembly factor FliW